MMIFPFYVVAKVCALPSRYATDFVS